MKAVKYFWFFSFIGYLAVALLVYADISTTVQIPSGENVAYALDKQLIFYYGLAAIVLINAIVLVVANATLYLPFLFKSKWQHNLENRKKFAYYSKEWVRGFGLIANLLLINTQFAVYSMNSAINYPYIPLFYGLGIMTVIWVIAYLPIFSRVPSSTN